MSTESHQRLAVFEGSDRQWIELVATVAAMANSGGGTIEIDRVAGGMPGAAGVERAVNEYVAPRVQGLEVDEGEGPGGVIRVPASASGPHVFTRDGLTGDDGAVFRGGQIWVRRGGADRPATADDVQRLVREAASRFLERLSIGIRDPGFALRLTDAGGIPVHLAGDEESVPVSPNLARLYPYTTKTLAAALGKPANWVATAAKVLGLKARRENAYGVPSPSGRIIQWRYSEHALALLKERIDEDPAWNPYPLLRTS